METLYIKRVAIIIMLLILMIIVPTLSNAANLDVALVKTEDDYIVYVNEMENKSFQFAFTNDNISETEAKTSLTFVKNWDDTNGINVACLEKGMVDTSKTVYLWIKDGEILSSVKLDLNKAITKQEMESMENLTKRISTKINQVTTKTETDGITKSVTLGELDITDSKDAKYKYQLIKIDGNEAEDIKNLNTLVQKLKNDYSTATMYDKILLAKDLSKAYNKVLNNSSLKDVENMVIYQPEESQNGDKYLVLLQKTSDGNIVNDIQFLDCTREYSSETVKDKKVVKTTSELPVTFDSIVLVVVLVVLTAGIITVVIRMKKLNSKNNEN